MLIIEKNKTISIEEMSAVFKNSGIRRPIHDKQRLKRMRDNATILYTAWQDGQIVGLLRGVSDGSYCCFISDLAVDKSYQRQGIGKKLMTALKQDLGPKISLVLLAAPEAMAYYPKLGFEQVTAAFKVPRKY
ncbi:MULTISPECIES: GNAT family N-acetyltransferase [Enterococcus]|uniref:GNAT family N-acetyltransferase n=1 Tax=Enterococcus TaxID=1350 RepID=UPI00065DDFE8|nr:MULTISPECIES: GNAT family N-acetyltransferase [Enterococcus]KAF1302343.1 GCN5 family acetyltransferase [Enterococcus sp. JM9B]